MNKITFLNAFHLKMIALLTMLIDNFGMVFYPQVEIYRIIGRISFMLFAFLLVEGTHHTKDFKGYLKRLFIWALISEIPFDLAHSGMVFNWQEQNIFFTLFLSAFGIYILKNSQTALRKISVIIATFFVMNLIKADYGAYGLIVIYLFYFIKSLDIKIIIIQLTSIILVFFGDVLQMWSGMAFIPILLYNQKQGMKTGKLFYSFYAVHLLLFSVINFYLNNLSTKFKNLDFVEKILSMTLQTSLN